MSEYTNKSEIEILKAALRECILARKRVSVKIVEFDPAGSTFESDWTDKVKEWAKLCDLDLSKHDPDEYSHSFY